MDNGPGTSTGTPGDQATAEGMYDYFLGGHRHVAADRVAAEQVRAVYPGIMQAAQANRAFLRRAVTYLVAHGIEQFVDLGSGMLTAGNAHEVAQRLNPRARVVHVDWDPLVVTAGTVRVHGNDQVLVLEADARQPAHLLGHPAVQRLIDWQKPVAVLMLAFLHFIFADQEAHAVVQQYRDLLVPGSAITITHASLEMIPPEIATQFEGVYRQTATPFQPRARAQIEGLFGDMALVAPGVVYVPLWRPEGPDDVLVDQPEQSINFGGVGWVRTR